MSYVNFRKMAMMDEATLADILDAAIKGYEIYNREVRKLASQLLRRLGLGEDPATIEAEAQKAGIRVEGVSRARLYKVAAASQEAFVKLDKWLEGLIATNPHVANFASFIQALKRHWEQNKMTIGEVVAILKYELGRHPDLKLNTKELEDIEKGVWAEGDDE